jgi:hypothetical protein
MADEKPEIMVSTSDNPYDYWDEFDLWYAWDETHGYHTLALLARVTQTSHDLPTHLEEEDIDSAIKEIVEYNVSGIHILVERKPSSKD